MKPLFCNLSGIPDFFCFDKAPAAHSDGQPGSVTQTFGNHLEFKANSMKRRNVHVLVKGRVQGVFFRAYTKDKADELHLGGWVRNLTDGRVEVCVEGEAAAVEKMLQWLSRGSPHSVVTGILQRELDLSAASSPFAIHPTAGHSMFEPIDEP